MNFKNKIASYFTGKMSLFRNSRGIATGEDHKQVWRTKEESSFYRGKGEVGRDCFQQMFLEEKGIGSGGGFSLAAG